MEKQEKPKPLLLRKYEQSIRKVKYKELDKKIQSEFSGILSFMPENIYSASIWNSIPNPDEEHPHIKNFEDSLNSFIYYANSHINLSLPSFLENYPVEAWRTNTENLLALDIDNSEKLKYFLLLLKTIYWGSENKKNRIENIQLTLKSKFTNFKETNLFWPMWTILSCEFSPSELKVMFGLDDLTQKELKTILMTGMTQTTIHFD